MFIYTKVNIDLTNATKIDNIYGSIFYDNNCDVGNDTLTKCQPTLLLINFTIIIVTQIHHHTCMIKIINNDIYFKINLLIYIF